MYRRVITLRLNVFYKYPLINAAKTNSFQVFRHKLKPSFKETLQSWIYDYFRKEDRYASLDRTLNCDVIDVKSTNVQELLNYWMEVVSKSYPSDEIEQEVVKRTSDSDFCETLTILDASVLVYKFKLTKSVVYNEALVRLVSLSNADKSLSPFYDVQFLFYSSLLKACKRLDNITPRLVKRLVANLDNFNNIEVSIICLSLFQCSYKPPEMLIDDLKRRLFKNIDWFVVNPSFLICFIKILRLAKHWDDSLFELLMKNYDKIPDVISQINILVYFCDSLHPDLTFVRSRVENVANGIRTVFYNGGFIRLKDLDNFLWCCSYYWNENMLKTLKEIDLSPIISKICNKHIEISEIFNVLLYASILKIDMDLCKYLNKSNVAKVKKLNNFKDLSRLSKLLTIVSLERSDFDENLLQYRETRLRPKSTKYFKKRPGLEELLKLITINREDLKLTDVKFDFPISCLFIGSITCNFYDQKISFELCDKETCFRNTSIPHGYMNLKLRLLDRSGVKYYLIKREVNDASCVLKDIKEWLDHSF